VGSASALKRNPFDSVGIDRTAATTGGSVSDSGNGTDRRFLSSAYNNMSESTLLSPPSTIAARKLQSPTNQAPTANTRLSSTVKARGTTKIPIYI
jgi:hypothetical protein